MDTDSTQESLYLGKAILESHWPRVGLGTQNIAAGKCLGRYAASRSGWVFERSTGGIVNRGRGDALRSLAQFHQDLLLEYPQAGLVGYVAYEFGYNLIDLPGFESPDRDFPIPLVQFLAFDRLGFNSIDSEAVRSHPVPPKHYSDSELQRLVEHPAVSVRTSRDRYLRSVGRIKDHIADGDIYQANLTQAFDVRSDRDGLELYRDLAHSNPASFSSYLRFAPVTLPGADGSCAEFPEIEIISCTPERFWRKRGLSVETRPIKGTIARSDDQDEDRQRLRTLLTSEKDRAELLMITDLLRNDFGRCADIGTVKTQALRRIRACASVWHMESIVTGTITPEIGWDTVMRSLFPGGSVTGAPKRRAVEILREIEPVPRGVYCGAIGWISADGDADFALAIRTLVKSGDRARVFGGGGIVADSDPVSEYHELLIKIAPILECLCRDKPIPDTKERTHAQTQLLIK
jgi:anthranilate/para-aminobenzoate synthase component I